MKTFETIREFFWPLLEKDEGPKSPVSRCTVDVESEKLDMVLELMFKMQETEEDRRKTVESKSSLFIGTISVATTVVIGVTSVLIKESDYKFSLGIMVFLLFVLTIYMTRTVWFSIKALERRNYLCLSKKDILLTEKGDEFTKKIISTIAYSTEVNSNTTNSKLDSMTMAQEYFKRAIVVVALYAFILIFFYFSKSEIDLDSFVKSLIQDLNEINLSCWNIVILYTLAIVSIVFSVRANFHKNKISK
jgi:hypothetical protein